jgi:hypothetical protein
MKITLGLSRLIAFGLLAAAPAAFAQQPPASPEPAARGEVRTYTGGRRQPDVPATAVATQTPASTSAPISDKGITDKGIKKVEEKPADLGVAPPADAGKGHSEKGIK